MSLVATLWGGREAISLLADLKAILDSNADDPDVNVRQAILQLRGDAVGVAERLSKDIAILITQLNELGINLDLPEQNAGNQVRGLFNLPKKIKFNRLESDLHSLQTDIRTFVDDVESLVMCAGSRRFFSETSTTSYIVRSELNAMALANEPIRKQLDRMAAIIEEMGRELRN